MIILYYFFSIKYQLLQSRGLNSPECTGENGRKVMFTGVLTLIFFMCVRETVNTQDLGWMVITVIVLSR